MVLSREIRGKPCAANVQTVSARSLSTLVSATTSAFQRAYLRVVFPTGLIEGTIRHTIVGGVGGQDRPAGARYLVNSEFYASQPLGFVGRHSGVSAAGAGAVVDAPRRGPGGAHRGHTRYLRGGDRRDVRGVWHAPGMERSPEGVWSLLRNPRAAGCAAGGEPCPAARRGSGARSRAVRRSCGDRT